MSGLPLHPPFPPAPHLGRASHNHSGGQSSSASSYAMPPPDNNVRGLNSQSFSHPNGSDATGGRHSSGSGKQSDMSPDVLAGKYKRLKAKYFEVEGKWKDSQKELDKAAQQNMRLKAEKTALLDRIIELESIDPSARAQNITTLSRALDELDSDHSEPDGDAAAVGRRAQKSRHIRDEEEMARQRALDKAKERDERDIRRPSKRAKTSSTAGAGGGPLLRTPSESSITMGEPIPPSHHHHPRPSIAHGHSSSSSSSRPRQNTANQAPSQYSLSPLSPLSPQTPHAQAPPSRSSTLPSATPSRPSRTAAPNVGAPSQHAYPIPAIPRDPNGEPILPLVAGVITVLNFGIISLKQHFHTERYIFPIGYEISRRYFSTIDPQNDAVYNCKILDGGEGPRFHITPSDQPDKPVVSGTATGAWAAIVRQANMIRDQQYNHSISGPDYFGLGHATIKHLIQQMDGAERLRNYVWQNFTEVSGRPDPTMTGSYFPEQQPPPPPPPPPQHYPGDSSHPYHSHSHSHEPSPHPTPSHRPPPTPNLPPNAREHYSRSSSGSSTLHQQARYNPPPQAGYTGQPPAPPQQRPPTLADILSTVPPEYNVHSEKNGNQSSNPPPEGGSSSHRKRRKPSHASSRSDVQMVSHSPASYDNGYPPAPPHQSDM